MRECDNLSGWVAPVLIEDGSLIFGSDERHIVKPVVCCWEFGMLLIIVDEMGVEVRAVRRNLI